MSGVDGKNGRVLTGLQVKESRVPALGFKKVSFLHSASAGDTVIDLTALSAPALATSNGYIAPSVTDLTAQNLKQFKENFKLISNGQALTQFVDYKVIGAAKIELLFEAQEGQIFEGVLDYAPRTGVSLLDAQPLVVTGVLLAGQTDFNVGTAFQLNKFPSQQVGAVAVYVDSQLVYRNTGNNAFGTGVDGDYQEVNAGGGQAVVIRFQADLTQDRNITVMSVGSLVERPDGSQIAMMEVLQGQIDAMIPVLADAADVSEASLQGAPNNVNLKAFGDRVLTNETIINTLLTAQVPIMTNWSDFTPTGDWTTNTTYLGKIRQVGDTAEIEISIELAGAPNAVSLASVNFLPTGLEADIAKISSSVIGNLPLVGYAEISDATGSNYHICNVSLQSSTVIRPKESSVSGSNVVASTITNVSPITFAANDTIKIKVKVPIIGWQATQTLKAQLGL